MLYLYIKQHQDTGLLYFGRTFCSTLDEVEKYPGSGKYWIRHLKCHGFKINTLCVWEFEDEQLEEAGVFALMFSEENDIVNSKKWANLRPENATDGTIKGTKFSKESSMKKSIAMTGRKRKPHSEETKAKIKAARQSQIMKPRTEESRAKTSAALKGNKNGTKISTEGREKIAAFNRGKIVSEETRKKMSDARKSYYANKN